MVKKKLVTFDTTKTYDFTEQSFGYEDDEGNSVTWQVKDIIEHTKHIKPVKVKVSLFKGFLEYKEKTYDAEDWFRVEKATFDYPIIIGTGTFNFTDDENKGRYPIIVDGVHRLVKAMINEQYYINAIITNTLPPPVVVGKGMQINGMKYKM